MVIQLVLRGVLAPFMHVAWSSIAGGAFWRVKRDRPFSVSMLFDGRFLMAFAIPVLMHTLWDLEVTLPNLFSTTNQAQAAYGGLAMIGVMALTGVISWYVIFTMIQQGLHQVRDMQMAQLQRTLAHVESTLGLGTVRAMA
jgi:RsiW-degrading membrane proteinase PrsW (M82 family)